MDGTLCHYLDGDFYIAYPITHIIVSLVAFITSSFMDYMTLARFYVININISTFEDDLYDVTSLVLVSNCF